RRHRPNGKLTTVNSDVRQVGYATDVHKQLRLRQPQLHQRQQAVPTRDHLGVWIIQQTNCFLERRGGLVGEFGRKHQCAPTAASSGFMASGFSKGSSPLSLRLADSVALTMF